ncbi:MAG: hypothetical protein KIT31_11545 [Deltaproteobacteria bacterium]|nr:hypothetical protein [Deltaproteobacteria bacterium]
MTEEAISYLCVARFEGIEIVFLWESGGEARDRVVLDDNDFILAFPSIAAAMDLTMSLGIPLSDEEASAYDLDAIQAWCKSSSEVVDCGSTLNAWNLFGDLPNVGKLYTSLDSQLNVVYDKLFRGCNFPSMTVPGEEYVARWWPAEIAALKRLLLLGLAEFRARLPAAKVRT